MRYIILNKNISPEETKSRRNYIEKVTNMYFISHKIDGGVEFKSVPSSIINCLFIVGHNLDVKNYLANNFIPEDNIVIVSCLFNLDCNIRKGKKVYVSFDNFGNTYYYDGTDWNLNFNVSEAELNIINSNGSFLERVEKNFRRIKWWKDYWKK